MSNLKNKLLIIVLLIAYNLFSQNVTNDSITVSKKDALKTKLELLDYDRLIENKVEENLNECVDIQKEQDTIIAFYYKELEYTRKNLILSNEQLNLRDSQLEFNKKKGGKGIIYFLGGTVLGTIIGVLTK